MPFYNIFILFTDIISGARTINERKATLKEKNAARMILRWKKHYPLTIAKCHNPLTGTEENRLMVDGKMVLRSSEIGFATKRAFEKSKVAGSK